MVKKKKKKEIFNSRIHLTSTPTPPRPTQALLRTDAEACKGGKGGKGGKGETADTIVSTAAAAAAAALGDSPRPRDTPGALLKLLREFKKNVAITREVWSEELRQGPVTVGSVLFCPVLFCSVLFCSVLFCLLPLLSSISALGLRSPSLYLPPPSLTHTNLALLHLPRGYRPLRLRQSPKDRAAQLRLRRRQRAPRRRRGQAPRRGRGRRGCALCAPQVRRGAGRVGSGIGGGGGGGGGG